MLSDTGLYLLNATATVLLLKIIVSCCIMAIAYPIHGC